jgi:two-component system, OmpR family, phosphate regulon sensor histidine kinase PhoR
MNAYRLPLIQHSALRREKLDRRKFQHLPLELLVNYAIWFCKFRWLFIALLLTYGIAGINPERLHAFGLRPDNSWVFSAALLLTLLNCAFIFHSTHPTGTRSEKAILINIWMQILSDLIILTYVVHRVGALETFFPFAYIFHIVLACIFFPHRDSFIVIVVAFLLFIAIVFYEYFLSSSSTGIYYDSILHTYYSTHLSAIIINILTVLFMWVIVWYLASHLSGMVRMREHELVEKNMDLNDAEEAKTKHLMRVTHEMKSPFAAIDASVQLLVKGHCGFIPDQAMQVLDRISVRSKKLGHEIQEMLQLSNLSSTDIKTLPQVELDIAEIISLCVSQIQPTAEKRMITLDVDLEPMKITSVKDHMIMLFCNLISNAVIYSHEGGTVKIWCGESAAGDLSVTISDQGIGIPEEKISKIFDEYYRTDEANRMNKCSTGLGLTIVKQVAQNHDISILVSSTPGEGSTFELTMPSSRSLQDVST